MSDREPGTCKQCHASGANWAEPTDDGNCYECGGSIEPQGSNSMTDLTPENVQELSTIVRENSGGTITEESERIHMTPGGDRLDILGPGWYLSVVAAHHEGGLEHARMALISLTCDLGKMLKSGEYEENILQSQGKTHEAGIARMKRLYCTAKADMHLALEDDPEHLSYYVGGLRDALEAMGEHVE